MVTDSMQFAKSAGKLSAAIKPVASVLLMGGVLLMQTLVIVLCLLGVFLVYGFVLNYFLKVEHYRITSEKLKGDASFVLLTDLHSCRHGRGNARLLEKIMELSPGFICIAGDMTVKDGRHNGRVLDFLVALSERYPVYYAPGNHEIRMPQYGEYREKIRRMGIRYLENETVDAGDGILITGLDLPEYWYHKWWQKRDFSEGDMEGLLGAAERGYRILLAHNPEYFPQYAGWGADLTLSGHVHGGILRLPLAGGVISPSLRLFPHYDAGGYEYAGRRMVVSRGLGLHHVKFRFFNRPEVSVVHLKSMV